jgi:hypothetical protein
MTALVYGLAPMVLIGAGQGGGSLGLSLLVTLFAAAHASGLDAEDLLAHRIPTALNGAAILLALALTVVVARIVRPSAHHAFPLDERRRGWLAHGPRLPG